MIPLLATKLHKRSKHQFTHFLVIIIFFLYFTTLCMTIMIVQAENRYKTTIKGLEMYINMFEWMKLKNKRIQWYLQ